MGTTRRAPEADNPFTAYGAEHDDVREDDEEDDEDEEDVPADEDIGAAVEEIFPSEPTFGATAIGIDTIADEDAPQMGNEDSDEPYIDWRRNSTLRARDLKREAGRESLGDKADQLNWERKHPGSRSRTAINDQQRFERTLKLLPQQKARREAPGAVNLSVLGIWEGWYGGYEVWDRRDLRQKHRSNDLWTMNLCCERQSDIDVERNVFTAYAALVKKGRWGLREDKVAFWQIDDEQRDEDKRRRWHIEPATTHAANYPEHVNGANANGEQYIRYGATMHQVAPHEYVAQGKGALKAEGISPSLWKRINDGHKPKSTAISDRGDEWLQQTPCRRTNENRAAPWSDDDLYLDGNTGEWMTWAKLPKQWMVPFIKGGDDKPPPRRFASLDELWNAEDGSALRAGYRGWSVDSSVNVEDRGGFSVDSSGNVEDRRRWLSGGSSWNAGKVKGQSKLPAGSFVPAAVLLEVRDEAAILDEWPPPEFFGHVCPS